MSAEKPIINVLATFESVPKMGKGGAKLHSGMRFRIDRYMFLVDNKNFYQLDVETKESKLFKSK
jgi:hypothetical protein